MYQLLYNNQIFSYVSIDEVIQSLHHLHIQSEPTIVVLRWNGKIHLQIGLGTDHDCMILLTIPKDSREDCKLAYNPIQKDYLQDTIQYESDGLTFNYSPYNLIALNDALQEIRYILTHDEASNHLRWHSS